MKDAHKYEGKVKQYLVRKCKLCLEKWAFKFFGCKPFW